MKIQLLWFPGCPNVEAARVALRDAMARIGVADTIEEIDVSAPSAPPQLRNWGSPTILIEGTDVGGQLAAEASSCRLYDGARVPSADAIERALRPALATSSARLVPAVGDNRAARTSRLPGTGAIFAALVASACCIGPAMLALIGLSGAALSAALAPWRPVFLVITGMLVAIGLYLAFRRRPADACGCPAPRTRRVGRSLMVIVAAVAVALAAYPWFLDADRRGGGSTANATAIARVEIDGITCAECADGIVRKLARVRGVGDVAIDTDRGLATIHYDPASTNPEALATAISEMPQYEARVAGP